MRVLKGLASRNFSPFIGEITRKGRTFYSRKSAVLLTDDMGLSALGYRGCITSGSKGKFYHPDHVYNVENTDLLNEGDIVRIDDVGNIEALWECNSHQNCLFLTERCNCRCVMCPQPPQNSDSSVFLNQAEEVLNLLKGKQISDCCLTGGEPTLVGDKFFVLLRRCVVEHPEAFITVLSNGKLFSERSFTRKLSNIPRENCIFCISLHSEIDMLHDAIVGVHGSCSATQQGIYNLASFGFPVEIRIVISRYNYRYLVQFAEHMYNYFPFCAHFVFMGLELHGCAAVHSEEIDVNPLEYGPYLRDAVLLMIRRGMPVSVYNIPLCMCPSDIRHVASQSISLWKNIWMEECNGCMEKDNCCGFFSTSVSIHKNFIKPFTERIER